MSYFIRKNLGLIKFMMFIIVVLLILAFFMRNGCNSEEKQVELKEMWPLKEGNTWNYSVKGGEEEKLEIEVMAEKQDQEHGDCYQVEFDFGTHQTYEYYSYDDTGIYWFQLDNPWGSYDRVPPEYLIKAPPTENKSWQWQGELDTITGSDLDFKGEGDISQRGFMELELPTGSYEALKVEKEMELKMTGEKVDLRDIRYYVPGVGLVKQEVYENGYEQLNVIIEDYEVES